MTSVSRRKQKSGAIAAIRERLAELARPAALRAAGWIAGVLVLASAWALGVPRLEAYASARHAALAPPGARFAAPVPAWAAGPLEADLLAVAAGRIGPDPLRRDDLVAAQQALLETGWFEEVSQVRREAPGLVEIEARFAEPLAVARVPGDGRDWLVDVRGRILPRSFDAGASGLPVIVGARFVTDGLGRPAALDPRDVTAAGALLQRVLPRPWHGQVARIELVHGAGDGAVTLRLVTDRGCSILWGRPPGQEAGSEVTADRKVEYLDYHHRQYGHIDRGFLRELDVTGEVVVGTLGHYTGVVADDDEPLLLPRGLILLASGWLIASWLLAIGVRAPVEPSSASYAPGVRVMLISMAVGLVVGWPLLRLSEPPTAFPLRRTILDLVVLLSLMQVVLWPLRLVTPWTPARTAALDATLIGWACIAGAVLAATSASRNAGVRCGAVAACVAMALGGPLLAWVGVVVGLPAVETDSMSVRGPLVETHQLAVAGSLPPTAGQWQWILILGAAAIVAWSSLAAAVVLRRRAHHPSARQLAESP